MKNVAQEKEKSIVGAIKVDEKEVMDHDSAVMLVGARLRHISTTKWGTRQYLNTCNLYEGGVL